MICVTIILTAFVPTAFAAPSNDAFSAAIAVGVPSSTAGTTIGATDEAGEPAASCGFFGDPGSNSVWYTATSSSDELIVADTGGSDFDTILTAYSGTSLGSLVEVGCNDDSIGLQSKISWTPVAGATYYIRVAGYFGDTGSLRLNLAQGCAPNPSNNCFDDAEPINAPVFMDAEDTSQADALGEPSPCGLIGSTVWYSFTAELPGVAAADTLDSTYDTVIAVYTGDSLDDLFNVACNDDVSLDLGILTSAVQFEVTQGVTYHIQVGGFFGDSGAMAFRFIGPTGLAAPAAMPTLDLPEGGAVKRTVPEKASDA